MQPAPMRQPEAPVSPSQSRERPKLTLAPRSDETAPAPTEGAAAAAPAAQPKKKVLPSRLLCCLHCHHALPLLKFQELTLT